METYNDEEIFDLIKEIKKEKIKHIQLTPGEYARLQNDLKGKAQLGVHVIPNKDEN